LIYNRNLNVEILSAPRTHRLYPRRYSGNHFCSELSRFKVHNEVRRIKSMKNSFNSSGIKPVTFWLVSQSMACRVGWGGGSPPSKSWNFYKAEPYSLFCGKYIHNFLIRIRVSLICKFSGSPD
jgi:hypothetical protein